MIFIEILQLNIFVISKFHIKKSSNEFLYFLNTFVTAGVVLNPLEISLST